MEFIIIAACVMGVSLFAVSLLFYFRLLLRVEVLEKRITDTINICSQNFETINKNLIALENFIVDHLNTIDSEQLIYEQMDSIEGISEKFTRLTEIAKEQLDLYGAAQSPSKSASHSKYKNEIIRKIKALDEEKYSIMSEILKKGVDPMVTTIDEKGKASKIKMSKVLEQNNKSKAQSKKTEQKPSRKNKKDGNVISLFDEGENGDPRDTTIH